MEAIFGFGITVVSAVVPAIVKGLPEEYQWLEKFFQMNKIEREVSETRNDATWIRDKLDSQLRREGNKAIDKWLGKAHCSGSPHILANKDVLRRLAAIFHRLQDAGVQELRIYDSNNVTAVVSNMALESNPEETLASLVTIATSESELKEVIVNGYGPSVQDEYDDIISEEYAAQRAVFILFFIDTLKAGWSCSYRVDLENSARYRSVSQLKDQLDWTWLLQKEAKKLDQDIKKASEKVTFEQFANAIDGSRQRRENEKLNVFIVGSPRSGKSATTWLLTGKKSNEFGNREEHRTRHVTAVGTSNGDHSFSVWDTPGLKSPYLYQDIFDKMMSLPHISTIIFHAKDWRHPSAHEIRNLELLDDWFGHELSRNLIVVFWIELEDENLDKQEGVKKRWENALAMWENVLEQSSVGCGIGPSNYFCFKWNPGFDHEQIAQLNETTVQRLKEIISQKPLCVLKLNCLIAKSVLASEDAKGALRLQNQVKQYEQYGEKIETIKDLLEEAWELSAIYDNQELKIKVVQPRTKRFQCSRAVRNLIIRAMCDRGQKFLREVSTELRKGRKGETSEWVEKICEGSFKFLVENRNDLDPDRPYPKCRIYPKDEMIITERVINPVQKVLGRRRTRDILKAASEGQ